MSTWTCLAVGTCMRLGQPTFHPKRGKADDGNPSPVFWEEQYGFLRSSAGQSLIPCPCSTGNAVITWEFLSEILQKRRLVESSCSGALNEQPSEVTKDAGRRVLYGGCSSANSSNLQSGAESGRMLRKHS